jgi:hypothetical protein
MLLGVAFYLFFAECECHYGECRYGECRHAECRGAVRNDGFLMVVTSLGI